MIQRRYNPNLCLAIMVVAVVVALALGMLEKQFGIFDAADALAIKTVKSVRSQYGNVGMAAVTAMGGETGLMIVVFILFWLGYTTEFVIFLLLLLFGNVVNARMKEFFELSRPSSHEIARVVDADGYGYPSGHSQNGMFYSWLIYMFVRKYWYLCLIPALLMAASRIYLGVHYFSDTVGGLLLGFGLVAGAMGIYGYVQDWDAARKSIRKSAMLKVALSLALSAGYLVFAWGLPEAFRYSGFLAGFFIVYSMLGFRWQSRNPFFSFIVILVGVIVLLSLRVGLSAVLPPTAAGNYCRYLILGVILAASPLAFTKLGLLKRTAAETGATAEQGPAEETTSEPEEHV